MNTTEVGACAQRTRTVTERDIALFTEISGDRNPIHYDTELAAASRFGSIVVQGGVTSGLLNALVAEQLPGPGSVFLEVSWKFLAPVRPGDVITARATVTSVRTDKPVTTLNTRVTNQAGTTVLDGTAVVWRDPVVAAASNGAPHHQYAGAPGTTEREQQPCATPQRTPAPTVWTSRRSSPPSTPSRASLRSRSSSSGPRTRGWGALTAGLASPASTEPCRRWSTSTSPRSSRTTRPCSPARTRHRLRSSTCCTASRPASPPGSPTSRPPAGSSSPRSARPSRATSTSSASSASPTAASGTATRGSR